jgi:hypothetical protein
MKPKKLKVTVRHGYEEYFKIFCEKNNMEYKQYQDPLFSCFSIVDNNNHNFQMRYFNWIMKIEDMPIVALG